MTSIAELGSGIKFWRRGRDPLVEQTLSFVKGIAASKPTELEPPQENYQPQLPKRADSDFMIAERADFSRRVLQFRDRQHKIRREREAHYNEIWEKTCMTLGNMKAGSAL